MASIAIMVAGAVLNATAFTGSTYLAKYLDGKHADEEKIRHDKALEKYEKDMGEWRKKRQEYQDWLETEYLNKKTADENLQSTDHAFTLYAKAHPDFNLTEPKFNYKPSNRQKQYELLYVGGGMIGAGYAASKFF